jgi:hypothetical protein
VSFLGLSVFSEVDDGLSGEEDGLSGFLDGEGGDSSFARGVERA